MRRTHLIAGDWLSTVLARGQARLAYTPYGGLREVDRAQSLPGFTGQPQDFGHYLLGSYRLFNVALMRFQSADAHSPFGTGGINAYAYCNGDPVNHRDPSGMAPPGQTTKKVKFLGYSETDTWSREVSNAYLQEIPAGIPKNMRKAHRRLPSDAIKRTSMVDDTHVLTAVSKENGTWVAHLFANFDRWPPLTENKARQIAHSSKPPTPFITRAVEATTSAPLNESERQEAVDGLHQAFVAVIRQTINESSERR